MHQTSTGYLTTFAVLLLLLLAATTTEPAAAWRYDSRVGGSPNALAPAGPSAIFLLFVHVAGPPFSCSPE